MAKSEPSEPTVATGTASRRDLAVARSLDSARTRAETRVQRFLDAAFELISSTETREFTVQEVVERSGQSLRSFYQYFGGKHELLLALYEESVRMTADSLREKVAAEGDPLVRLHRLVIEYYRMCRPAPKGKTATGSMSPSPVLIEFVQELLTADPAEATRAFVPLVDLFETVLDDAADAGAIRAGLNRRRIAGIVLGSIMYNVFSSTIAGPSGAADGTENPEELWSLILHGLGSPAGQ